MQRNFILIIYTLLIQAAAYASSASTEGHTPSAGDLKWKFISFFIVFFFVGKFAKKLMKENFSKMHEIIKAKFDEAETKNKEAELKLKMFEEKLANLKNHVHLIQTDTNESIKQIDERVEVETKDRLHIIKRELEAKLASEKSYLERKMNQEIIEEVVGKAKEKIVRDGNTKAKVTQKLMAGI
ncbi:MAG: hypothetical protein A2504_06525 [Bdellovibrionales bacterium RIFOXYD12_FULL_39_22]|nr:MAG: hypothetical protein A2385_08845 [Bdellovibrionales bacterium RIFOXYB1_FULL_39_21]OFZ45193.1 MAG: hypothetical protein A2485_05690 [Bdellovibrionales bacterium RIFOXYC12_FULL_39_17]OFZ45615.1 MAG: hypothetical protein A2404_03425 [Bdellovibrionales bacterium RIFOXYC1_FULL_39_130]OFZ77477.1 MAG: hypothetical protein A2560_09015 [Bdellovibrionales bacterium RIFOXYD1_FULL_39_84]OFZ91606.1 MAG: hypothetical protein A2504_06525 [Bdellovibrionales bacterium RIFOXYD12_FULL_39_22]HLE11932.1 hy